MSAQRFDFRGEKKNLISEEMKGEWQLFFLNHSVKHSSCA